MHNSLLDVIEFAGDNSNLVHRSVIENFNSKSQLIVNEAQEAIFYKDGQALDLFGAGRHSLTTENLPLLRKLVGVLFGGKTPYKCEVFFINKVNVLDIMWGTDSPITLEDPKYHLFIDVRSNGTMGVQVEDSRRFLVNVVGQLQDYSVDQVKRAIKGAIMTVLKNSISHAINEEGISILEINSHLMELGNKCLELINKEISYFGIKLPRFYINSIACGDVDLQMLKDAKAKAASMIVEAEAKAASRRIQGYDYRTERQFDVLETAAGNEGGAAGAFVGAGVGLGAGLGVGKAIGDVASQSMNPSAGGSVCPKCGASVPQGAKFCPSCGQKLEGVQKRFCPNCGQEVKPDAKFCPNCGQKVGE